MPPDSDSVAGRPYSDSDSDSNTKTLHNYCSWVWRLWPLGHSDMLPIINIFVPNTLWNFSIKKKTLSEVGFEPTPPLDTRTPKHCTSMQNYCSWVWRLRPLGHSDMVPIINIFLPNTLWNFSIKKKNSVRSARGNFCREDQPCFRPSMKRHH